MSLLLNGIGVSRGIVIGQAHVADGEPMEILEYNLPRPELDSEVDRFHQAREAAKEQLSKVREQIPEHAPTEIGAFIDTHLLMLDDEALSKAVEDLIRQEQCNAEWALQKQRDQLVAVFDEMDDPYLRTRRDDVDHVVNRVQRLLTRGEDFWEEAHDEVGAYPILVAEDLSPADLVMMQSRGVRALITESGGPLSHTSILARSLGIPAVVGLHRARQLLRDGESLIIDGLKGAVFANPGEREIAFYRRKRRELWKHVRELKSLRGARAETLDGTRIQLMANIELPEDLKLYQKTGGDGIGLYRTEFLYMNRPDFPDEDEQHERYQELLAAADGAPVTIRTLDLGADKRLRGSDRGPEDARNPALGLRGIRYSLSEPNTFLKQLRALLRASADAPLRIMLPLVTTAQEVLQAQQMVEVAKQTLDARGQDYDPAVPIGAMIEVPSAALTAHQIARHVDFLSIGTNDLIQYTLAIDRVDDHVNYLYDPVHPSVLKLISNTLQAGQRIGIPVSMCGEMAGDPQYTRLLLGLGLREFSMHPSTLLEVKRVITRTNLRDLKGRTRAFMQNTDPGRAPDLLRRLNANQG
ncbi:phosphoenolpyruvate--protein phosphotransferase [Natronospira bacteriovora]|uniref:Phosphoenolpyruvate-protein phosphotransferase n=1 Tax=Natronospira bacteriovora TaxID=3069753 RepID=A0ABU0W6B0_9GAMM|nr:phosphoenolpyruvate--protein phosphotransferase [Natronospira sp. AB-CW4]MDQ2069544.1 phosphoenolpyruvate--protein phosphotransferase [Natronospira sp. AB-CW4]